MYMSDTADKSSLFVNGSGRKINPSVQQRE